MLDKIVQRIGEVTGWLDERLSYVLIPGLLLTGLFLTLRLGFIQLRKFGHGLLVTSGKLDKAGHTGDVSHFQALTTALSATVGVGNIAGVAMAIHFGGPGALFWMWVTAFFGSALKYTECTLALHYRDINPNESSGAVSGGPMYYMAKGLKMPKLAAVFAGGLLIASLFTGNAIQANTMADVLSSDLGVPTYITGLVSAALVAAVILGGIHRIGHVSSILAPGMAVIYIAGALGVLVAHYEMILPAFATIFEGAFNPVAGLTGVGAGAMLTTLTWGVKRGLYSNEAGQGSAPIAHAAARTEEPVSEGTVALLEPFIDTIIVCTLTGLVLVVTGAWDMRFPTAMPVSEITFVDDTLTHETGRSVRDPAKFQHGTLDQLFVDAARTTPFEGVLSHDANGITLATAASGEAITTLYGDAVEVGAPLTARAFQMGLSRWVSWGNFLVALCVVLFAISTAISWSYYGDRCAMYLWGHKAILPYKITFVILHFIGATAPIHGIWSIGDVSLSLCTLPNIFALILLSPQIKRLTDSYFARRPWEHESPT